MGKPKSRPLTCLVRQTDFRFWKRWKETVLSLQMFFSKTKEELHVCLCLSLGGGDLVLPIFVSSLLFKIARVHVPVGFVRMVVDCCVNVQQVATEQDFTSDTGNI